jgi:hypothetical protein
MEQTEWKKKLPCIFTIRLIRERSTMIPLKEDYTHKKLNWPPNPRGNIFPKSVKHMTFQKTGVKTSQIP